MMKKSLLVLICLTSLIIFVSALYGQGPKKTITLPSGEVIYDLSGEWNVLVENYGDWESSRSYPQVWKIVQEGSFFSAVRLIDDPKNLKDSQAIRGELDKNGIKQATVFSASYGPLESRGEISDDGNKIIINVLAKVRMTATRK